MYSNDFFNWLRTFFDHNFMEAVRQKAEKIQDIEWSPIGSWAIFFIVFLLVMTYLLCKSRLIEKLSKHILQISMVVWILGVFVYIVGFYSNGVNGLSVVLRAIISSFKMFVVSHDLARVPDILQKNALYMTMFSVLHFVAAFVAFLFIFKMIGYKIKSSLRLIVHRYFRSKGKAVHLFWGVNEASCLLAEDIRKQHATETIIFVDIDKETEDNTQRKATLSFITNTITIKNSEIARLDAMNAFIDHCYNGPAVFKEEKETDIFGNLNLKTIGSIVQKCSKINMYFLSNDEAQNIAGALNMQKDKRLRSKSECKPVVYVHARKDANNEIFDHYSQYEGETERIKIKIIDSAYLSIETLKRDDRSLPVNCIKIDTSTGLAESPFTSLIVGFGETGLEAFKFLYEFSAFINTDLKKNTSKCYAIDGQMNKFAGLIKEKMPDIGDEELSLIQTSINSKEFWATIKSIIKELNYVVIAINNDETGLSLAVNLFKYALMNRPTDQQMLKIMLRCYDNGNEKRMTEVADNLNRSIEGNNIEIRLFGLQKDLYRCNTILSDKTLQEAMEFNKVYEKSDLTAEEQWKKNFGEEEINRLMTKKKMSRFHAIYDINRRIAQNISNSQHCRTKMTLMGFGENDSSERLKLYYGYVKSREENRTKYKCNNDDEQLLQHLAMVEHERWVASHRLMGYTYNPENDCVQKHHKCICPWNELDEMTQSYDCNVVDTTIMMAFNKLK